MTIGWNILGIFAWLVIILYLVFIVQNIRKRHLLMIVRDRKRFRWTTTLIDAIEVIVFFVATIFMVMITFFTTPDLENKKVISSKIEYEPLIMSTDNNQSYYVVATSSSKSAPRQRYKFYSNKERITVSSNYASISDGKDPMSIEANAIPYSKEGLEKADKQYQNAYVSIYTATYKKNWYNGIGLHSGKMATRYYLIRIPDQTFVKRVKD
ncbi:LVIS_2131 family protein [Lactobacillus sp. PV034]|uniref:LVIS_2131 family protein n=1 Tax=Lactobacillus sp. PV034 TaxID=2594495 RepID=UPI00223FD5DB|nr:LVIS_2131 family protein [Lactobacillus sp. PV034]QNQ81283.1 hypothetical protein FP432_06815 [Lactobacillus sp. PV034]